MVSLQQVLKTDPEVLALAAQSSLIKPDEEVWLLSADEENEAISNELLAMEKQLAAKMTRRGYTTAEIIQAINDSTDSFRAQIDRDSVLKRANSFKSYDIWQKAQREKEKVEAEEKLVLLKKTWHSKQFFNLMQWTSVNEFGRKLIVNDHNKHLIKSICYFLSRDERFETEFGYSLQKGIIIRGVSGLGKTYLINLVRNNELNPLQIESMNEIAYEVKRNGNYEIQYKGGTTLYLDDVGTEATPIVHFGTKVNWFKDFIELRYDRKLPFNQLIISTNISFDEIENKYTHRVRSRMREMFNVIDVTGEDLRG